MDSYSSPIAPRPQPPQDLPTFDYIDCWDSSREARDEVITATVVSEPVIPRESAPARPAGRSRLAMWLFIATCLSTYWVAWVDSHSIVGGFQYSAAVMFILGCHEMGHYLQARRYRIKASLPFFIPMPISPIGTMGAVIAMQSRMGDRKSLFDIGISGPLAGLVPTLVCCVVGIHLSQIIPIPNVKAGVWLGEPLLFHWLREAILGPFPAGHTMEFHPIAFAGWVGLLITALNLIPIGQLDGGHVLYGLVRTKAHIVARLLLLGAMVAMVLFSYWGWMLMIFLLILIGPEHPPTANDEVRLGPVRTVLGWLTLAFIPLGFTPIPFTITGG